MTEEALVYFLFVSNGTISGKKQSGFNSCLVVLCYFDEVHVKQTRFMALTELKLSSMEEEKH